MDYGWSPWPRPNLEQSHHCSWSIKLPTDNVQPQGNPPNWTVDSQGVSRAQSDLAVILSCCSGCSVGVIAPGPFRYGLTVSVLPAPARGLTGGQRQKICGARVGKQGGWPSVASQDGREGGMMSRWHEGAQPERTQGTEGDKAPTTKDSDCPSPCGTGSASRMHFCSFFE